MLQIPFKVMSSTMKLQNPRGKGNHFYIMLLVTLVSHLSVFTVVKGEETECYVCSWQKPTGKLEMVDNCSHYHFNPKASSVVSCEFGCEAISYRKSKNEDIYHFARNCLTKRRGLSTGEDKCYNMDEKVEEVSACECHSDLCNDAVTTFGRNSFFIFTIALSLPFVFSGFIGL